MRKEKLLLKNLVQAVHTFLKKAPPPKTSSNKTISTPPVHKTTPDKPAPALPVAAKSCDDTLSDRGKDDASKTGSKPSAKKASRPSWQVSQFVVPEVEGKFRFHDLGLPTTIMHAISDLGFEYCLQQLYRRFEAGELSLGYFANELGLSVRNLYAALEQRGLPTSNIGARPSEASS